MLVMNEITLFKKFLLQMSQKELVISHQFYKYVELKVEKNLQKRTLSSY